MLVALSLALITGYFRESDGGALHDLQGAGATALHPFEVGADRVVRPFRDAYAWFDDLLSAKSENEKLREENRKIRRELVLYETRAFRYESLGKLLGVHELPGIEAFAQIPTDVAAPPATPYDQRIVVAVGSNHGVVKGSPVVTADGLVGRVTRVAPRLSRVTLITDPESAVAAVDPKTEAWGIVQHGQGGSESLVMSRVEKRQTVNEGDIIVTAGAPTKGALTSAYPPDIPIGTVTNVGQRDVDPYKRILLQPFVDMSQLRAVIVLIPRSSGGDQR